MNWFKQFWKALNTPAPTGSARARTSPRACEDEVLCNFTPRAQQVLALSRKEAERFNHYFVGTEHLLLGLIALGQGVAVNVLAKLGLDLETVRKEIEHQVGSGPVQKTTSLPPYTPRVKKVLRLADRERRALNHTYLGTEHILLGLLREGDGVAARVLKNLDVDIEQTRMEILKELDPNFATNKPETAPEDISGPKTEVAAKLNPHLIDIEKRYDVYCSEQNQDVVVYRNARFKGIKRLFQKPHENAEVAFIELEQADGQEIFVATYSVIKFCAPGTTPNAERL